VSAFTALTLIFLPGLGVLVLKRRNKKAEDNEADRGTHSNISPSRGAKNLEAPARFDLSTRGLGFHLGI
jgi:hypothetical protein